jgi:hypothetical protein
MMRRDRVVARGFDIAPYLTGPVNGLWRVHATTMVLEADRLVVTSTDDVRH